MSDTLPANTRAIGRYSILRELRRERHSVSYAAVDPVMNRQLVVKAVELLPAGPRLSAEERKRVEEAFVRQAQAAGRLQHPHIVTVFDAGLSHAFGFLVIERINGRPLHELLAGGLRPAFVQCASIVARIADAIECAHRNGVAHGHLGPQHVYLLSDGAPKVSGFGGWIDDGASGDEALAGTSRLLPYFQNEITEETRQRDVKAIGELLYMLLVGRAPPDKPSGHGGSPTLSARPQTPAVLAAIADQAMLGTDPAGLRTAGSIRDALTAFIWNERTDNVAPNTLGIPLTAPPATAPEPAAAAAAARAGASAAVAAATPAAAAPVPAAPCAPASLPRTGTPAERAPVHVATLSPQSGLAPAPEALTVLPQETPPGGTASAGDRGIRATAPASTATPMPGVADIFRALGLDLPAILERVRPWATRHRLPLFTAGALLSAGIFLGVLLGNLRHPESTNTRAIATDAAPAAVPPAATPAGASGAPSTVALDIQPWGEVFVDGKATGVSPPLTHLELPDGHHHIEVRQGSLPSSPVWETDIDVPSPVPQRIEHHFE